MTKFESNPQGIEKKTSLTVANVGIGAELAKLAGGGEDTSTSTAQGQLGPQELKIIGKYANSINKPYTDKNFSTSSGIISVIKGVGTSLIKGANSVVNGDVASAVSETVPALASKLDSSSPMVKSLAYGVPAVVGLQSARKLADKMQSNGAVRALTSRDHVRTFSEDSDEELDAMIELVNKIYEEKGEDEARLVVSRLMDILSEDEARVDDRDFGVVDAIGEVAKNSKGFIEKGIDSIKKVGSTGNTKKFLDNVSNNHAPFTKSNIIKDATHNLGNKLHIKASRNYLDSKASDSFVKASIKLGKTANRLSENGNKLSAGLVNSAAGIVNASSEFAGPVSRVAKGAYKAHERRQDAKIAAMQPVTP